MANFHHPKNNAQTTVASVRTAGAHTLNALDASQLSSQFPYILTVVRSGSALCILEVTGASGNALAVSGAIEGTTDVDLVVGDLLVMRPTALAITEIHSVLDLLGTTPFAQLSPSALWAITHNLGRFPSVTVVDSAGSVCVGSVQYLNNNQITIGFSAAFAGTAYLN